MKDSCPSKEGTVHKPIRTSIAVLLCGVADAVAVSGKVRLESAKLVQPFGLSVIVQ